MATAIEFNNISKLYRLGLVSTGTLAHDLKRWWITSVRGKEDPYLRIGEVNDRSMKGESDYVWALRDINFKVEQGDVVGIIGKNGAGKSTLLKILSRVTAPTTGAIRARGRIGSLLEVGTGFHPEMTGRENIYLNGAILGMTKAEITRKLDEIVDFSGCERYLDTPVKRYSSGMMVRLGFAVAAHLDPEILVVDEVLAVGDAEFQKKAIGKMQDVSHGEGRTVLFVSHNMAAVRKLCKTGILLENGQIKKTGYISNVVDEYLSEEENLECRADYDGDDAPGFDTVKIRHIRLINEKGHSINFGYITNSIGICVDYEVLSDTPAFTHGLNIFDISGAHLFTSHDNTFSNNQTVRKGFYRTIAWIPANLLQCRDYFLTFAFMRYAPFQVLFHSHYLIKIHMVDDLNAPTRMENYNEDLPGMIRPVINWSPKTNL